MGAIDDALNGLDSNEAALEELKGIRDTSEASVTQITDLTTQVSELTATNKELTESSGDAELQKSISEKDAEIALLNGQVEIHTNKATEFEALTLKATGLETRVTELTDKQSNDIKARLKVYGVEDTQVVDKSLEILEAMETAAISARGTTQPPVHGHGMGSGGDAPSTPKTALEAATAQMEVIKANPNLNGATNSQI